MMTVQTSQERAEQRRERLRVLMDRLEAALAEPAHRSGWRETIGGLSEELHAELDRHVADTEGPDGLFEEVLARAPRLRNAVATLRHEHPALQQTLGELSVALAAATADDAQIETIRALGSKLLVDLIRHRQRGADLLYETYWIDVAPSD